MTKQLIEFVPNFSEGRDMSVIKQITDQIESVEGVKLLDVDPEKAINRAVVSRCAHRSIEFTGICAEYFVIKYLTLSTMGSFPRILQTV